MSGFFPRAIIKSEKVKQQPKLSTDQHKKPSHDTNMQMMEKLTTSSRSHSRDNRVCNYDSNATKDLVWSFNL